MPPYYELFDRFMQAPYSETVGAFIVDLRINGTLPMHSQPPKSPLSGGLLKLRKGWSYW